MSSFMHYQQGKPPIEDPDNAIWARYYLNGLNQDGEALDPCTWANGTHPSDCATIDNRYWYSGDPVAGTGWINTIKADQRQMQNTGPFELHKDQEVEIVTAYIVGQGASSLESVNVAKSISDGAQFIFDKNFASPTPPPSVTPMVQSTDDAIELTWETSDQVSYVNKSDAWDLRFKGFNIYAYETNSTQETINGQVNAILYKSYQLDDFILNTYKEDAESGGIDLLYPESDIKLDKDLYMNPETGRIRLRITSDPITGGDLIKGKQYYFANYFICIKL